MFITQYNILYKNIYLIMSEDALINNYTPGLHRCLHMVEKPIVLLIVFAGVLQNIRIFKFVHLNTLKVPPISFTFLFVLGLPESLFSTSGKRLRFPYCLYFSTFLSSPVCILIHQR